MKFILRALQASLSNTHNRPQHKHPLEKWKALRTLNDFSSFIRRKYEESLATIHRNWMKEEKEKQKRKQFFIIANTLVEDM